MNKILLIENLQKPDLIVLDGGKTKITVCKEWMSYENFKNWFDNNYYEIDGEIMCLDKDILFKNNTIYSPKTCVFTPKRINNLFTKRQNDRGDYYIGVTYHKKTGKFESYRK